MKWTQFRSCHYHSSLHHLRHQTKVKTESKLHFFYCDFMTLSSSFAIWNIGLKDENARPGQVFTNVDAYLSVVSVCPQEGLPMWPLPQCTGTPPQTWDLTIQRPLCSNLFTWGAHGTDIWWLLKHIRQLVVRILLECFLVEAQCIHICRLMF